MKEETEVATDKEKTKDRDYGKVPRETLLKNRNIGTGEKLSLRGCPLYVLML